MGQTKINWHEKEVIKNVSTKLEQNMTNAGAYLEGRVKSYISRPSPNRGKKLRDIETPKKIPKLNLNSIPSGRPPGVWTNALRSSIGYEVRKDSSGVYCYVGVRRGVATADANPYALILEYGTAKRGPHSFLRNTLRRERKKIFKLILGK